MDLTTWRMMQSDPGPLTPREPKKKDENEDDAEDEAVTLRNPPLEQPATPDANPIDPRVFGG